jgi:tRNA pseudouridine38-40 synthase
VRLESGESAAAQRYRATVQYDGTAYNGFQRQRRGVPSIQAELEQALARVTGQTARVLGAGRTDAGVHALGQVIGFTIEQPWQHGRPALLRALNANLPPDIVVSTVEDAPPQFHPRFDARRRTYAYHIVGGPVRQPLLRHRAWHVAQPLDVSRMNEAAAILLGVHDFATFGRVTTGESTVREVFAAQWRHEGELLIFDICANAFLQRMVRSVVGSLKAVGSGHWTVETFAAAMVAGERKRSATAAPAHGLYLLSVEYDD